MSHKLSRKKVNILLKRESEVWLYSYADLITNLLALFILLVAMSKMDTQTVDQVRQSIKRATTKPFGETNSADMKFAASVTEFIRKHDLKNVANLQNTVDGISLTFSGGFFFETLSADLTPEAQKILDTLAPFFKELPPEMRIDVGGHSDTLRITDDSLFPSNWELSASRAASVVRFLASRDVPTNKLRAIGYADTQPISKVLDQNRRVVIRVGRGLVR